MFRMFRNVASLTTVAFLLGSVSPADAASFPRVTTDPSVVAPFDAPQFGVDVAALDGGGFVVVFTEGRDSSGVILPLPPIDGRDGDVEGIVAQRVDAEGAPVAAPFVVNTNRTGRQSAPSVAADPVSGGFVVGWLDLGQPMLRRFDATGSPTTDELSIADLQVFTPNDVLVAVDPNGHALAVWEPVDAGSPIWAASVDRDGQVGLTYPVTEEPSGYFRHPQLVASPSGGFFVTWFDEGGLRGRHLEPSGAPLSPVLDLGSLGPLDDLVPLDPSGASHDLLATTRPSRSPDPVQLFVIDPVSVTSQPAIELPYGTSPRTLALDSESFLHAAHQGTGPRLQGIGADGQATGQLPLDGTVFGPIALAIDADDRVLVAWSGEDENIVVQPMVFDSPRLRLGFGQRFEVRVTWRDFEGQSGEGLAIPLADDTGGFWFFDPANVEVTVKVLDGRVLNGHFWVFNGSLTNVEYTLTVTDTMTGRTYRVTNPLGQFGSFGDTEALPGPWSRESCTMHHRALLTLTLLIVSIMPTLAVETLTPATPVAPTDKPQSRPVVTTLSDGNFLVLLEDGSSIGDIIDPPYPTDGRDGDDEAVLGQRFDRRGRPLGSPFLLNSTTRDGQLCPRAAVDPSTDGFVAAWIDQQRSDRPVVRRFTIDGTPIGDEIPIDVRFTIYCGTGIQLDDAGGVTLAAWTFDTIEVFRIAVDGTVTRTDSRSIPQQIGFTMAEMLPTHDGGAILLSIAYDTLGFSLLPAEGRFVGDDSLVAATGSVTGVLRPIVDDYDELWIAIANDDGVSIVHGSVMPIRELQTVFLGVLADWVALDVIGSDVVLLTAQRGGAPGADPTPGVLTVRRLTDPRQPVGDVAVLGAAAGSFWETPIDVAVNADGQILAAWEETNGEQVVSAAFADIDLHLGDRFTVEVTWQDFDNQTGLGFPISLSNDTGAFWFFDPANIELTVKVLDGRVINGHFWVFNGSLTNVAYTLTVTDTVTGAVYTFANPLGQFGSFGDVEALPGT
ncbi:MAG: hypothetical protein AAGE94_02255 [Acidobacteriota bacterium]